MENVSVGQYRSHDQPKNFAVKVVIKQVTSAFIIPSAQLHLLDSQNEIEMGTQNTTNEEETEEITIHWQEKLFSEKEFDFYSDTMNCLTPIEQKYNEDIQEMKRKHGGRLNRRIFTYVDSDSSMAIVDNIEHDVTTIENESENILVQRMEQLKYTNFKGRLMMQKVRTRRNVVNSTPGENFKSNHVITTPNKLMYIMADVGIVDSNGVKIEDERILCVVKLDANGSLVVKPDICKKESYTVETNYDTRCMYQYTLEHVSKTMTKEEEEHERLLRNELYTRHVQLLNSQVGNDVYPKPQDNELHMYCFCEIVSAKDFEYDSLYIQYVLDLPNGWFTLDDNVIGTTQSCYMNKDYEAHFGYPIDFQLFYKAVDNEDSFVKWPVLYLQVFSLDSWQRHRIEGYGYCQLPDVAGTTCVQINMWRPKGDELMSEVRRFFIGGMPELENLSYIKDLGNNDKMNRFYFKTVNTGSVILKLNTLFHTKVTEEELASQKNSKWKKVKQKRTSAFASAVDSLAHVFDAFHRARKRMLAARSTLPDMT